MMNRNLLLLVALFVTSAMSAQKWTGAGYFSMGTNTISKIDGVKEPKKGFQTFGVTYNNSIEAGRRILSVNDLTLWLKSGYGEISMSNQYLNPDFQGEWRNEFVAVKHRYIPIKIMVEESVSKALTPQFCFGVLAVLDSDVFHEFNEETYFSTNKWLSYCSISNVMRVTEGLSFTTGLEFVSARPKNVEVALSAVTVKFGVNFYI